MRIFLSRHKEKLQNVVRKRSVEKQKASKHQIELALCHFRNFYRAEAMGQIQREMASGEKVPGFQRFPSIVHRNDPNDISCLLEV